MLRKNAQPLTDYHITFMKDNQLRMPQCDIARILNLKPDRVSRFLRVVNGGEVNRYPKNAGYRATMANGLFHVNEMDNWLI